MNRPIEDDPALPAVTLDIEKLIGGGRGLAHHDGATWMVMGALPGERVVAQTFLPAVPDRPVKRRPDEPDQCKVIEVASL